MQPAHNRSPLKTPVPLLDYPPDDGDPMTAMNPARLDIDQQLSQRPDATTNHEGALAFRLDPYTELYITAASYLVGEGKFYEPRYKAESRFVHLIQEMCKRDPEYVLQLALFLRNYHYMRDTPLMMLGVYANIPEAFDLTEKGWHNKVPYARQYVTDCIQRPDAIANLIAYCLNHPGKKGKLPAMIKNGCALAFPKFDGYRLKKNDHPDRQVKLRDAMFLCHPKPKDETQAKVFEMLADDALPMVETWETMRSTGKMTWHDVIHQVFYKSGRVNNYMAILRNLRNCLESPDVTLEDVDLLCRMISDRKAVLRSKQLPFRFLSAYKILTGTSSRMDRVRGRIPHFAEMHPMINQVLAALEAAIGYSVENLPRLPGTTLIACDVSGSMEAPVSKNSSVERYDIGIILGMMANSFCDKSITGFFGDIWKPVPLSRKTGILQNALEMHRLEGEVGYATNGYLVIDYLLENRIPVDRIMIFTDCQMWNSNGCRPTFAGEFTKYKRLYPQVRLYSFDLSGYGDVMIPQDIPGVAVIGGWSDRVLQFVNAFENGGSMVEKIRQVKPSGAVLGGENEDGE